MQENAMGTWLRDMLVSAATLLSHFFSIVIPNKADKVSKNKVNASP